MLALLGRAAFTGVGDGAFGRLLAGREPALAILLLQQALARHRRSHHTVVVFGVLKVILVLHTVAARLGVARVL